jgi:DnaJ-class molecular chaperone
MSPQHRITREVVIAISGQDSCASCGGRGWKFVHLRRSLEVVGGTSEGAGLLRARVPCLYCNGTGECVPVAA